MIFIETKQVMPSQPTHALGRSLASTASGDHNIKTRNAKNCREGKRSLLV